jgi:thiol-disulfide isomerase/thioredoxin
LLARAIGEPEPPRYTCCMLNTSRHASRRNAILSLTALSLNASVLAKAGRASPGPQTTWTLEQERAAAKQAAQLISDATGEAPHPAAGEILRFNQTVPLIDSRAWDEKATQGHLLMVFFWASWCPVCKALAPKLQQFWLAHRHQGLQLLGVSADKSPQITQATAKKLGFRFPIVMSSDLRLDPVFQTRSFPTLLVRSKRGAVVSVEEGDLSKDEMAELLVHL